MRTKNYNNTAPLDPNFSVTDRHLVKRVLDKSYPIDLAEIGSLMLIATALLTGQIVEFRGARHQGQEFLIAVFRDSMGICEDIGVFSMTADKQFVALPSTIVRSIFGGAA